MLRDQREVELARGELREQVLRGVVRERGHRRAHQAVQGVDQLAREDPQRARAEAQRRDCRAGAQQQVLDVVQQRARPLDELGTDRGQGCPAGVAVEEHDTELGLDPAQLARHERLVEPQRPGGGPDAAGVRDRETTRR